MKTIHIPPGAVIGIFDSAGHALSGVQIMPFRTARLNFRILRSGYPIMRAFHSGKEIDRLGLFAAYLAIGDTVTLHCTGYANLAEHITDHERRCAVLEQRAGVAHLRRGAELRLIWRRIRERMMDAALSTTTH